MLPSDALRKPEVKGHCTLEKTQSLGLDRRIAITALEGSRYYMILTIGILPGGE